MQDKNTATRKRTPFPTPEWDSELGCYRLRLSGYRHRDKFILVDEQDVEIVSKYRWYPHIKGRSVYAQTRPLRGVSPIRLHRLIMKPEEGMVVDHINHDGLDNRRQNLRCGTQSQNMMNKGASKSAKTSYKGIWQTRQGWVAVITTSKNERRYLGTFTTAETAARAYDDAARRHHGEFAFLNFPDE